MQPIKSPFRDGKAQVKVVMCVKSGRKKGKKRTCIDLLD